MHGCPAVRRQLHLRRTITIDKWNSRVFRPCPSPAALAFRWLRTRSSPSSSCSASCSCPVLSCAVLPPPPPPLPPRTTSLSSIKTRGGIIRGQADSRQAGSHGDLHPPNPTVSSATCINSSQGMANCHEPYGLQECYQYIQSLELFNSIFFTIN